MRIWIHRALAMILVMALLLPGSAAAATEEIQQETVPAVTEPAPTEAVPEETEPLRYTVNTESEIYRVCEETAAEMTYDQLLVYDATADEILYMDTREGRKLYPASITKLFSAYVALQYLDPLDPITARRDVLDLVQPGSSVAYIGSGSQLYTQMVIEGMMLPSGNDAAMVLAAAAGWEIADNKELSAEEAVQAFVGEMNRMAQELGFERSHFSNPDGWHTGSHYTCLEDMARIAKLALDNKTIARYMRTGKDEVTFLSGHKLEWKNTNTLVSGEDGFWRGDAIGMKTGYTRQAEYCLMSAFNCGNKHKLVIGVFGYADEYQRFREVIRMADACKALMK